MSLGKKVFFCKILWGRRGGDFVPPPSFRGGAVQWFPARPLPPRPLPPFPAHPVKLGRSPRSLLHCTFFKQLIQPEGLTLESENIYMC